MGKKAKNELIKLEATYFNKLAAGSFLGGIFIPYFVLLQPASETAHTIKALITGTPGLEDADVKALVASLLSIALAFLLAGYFRAKSRSIISRLED